MDTNLLGSVTGAIVLGIIGLYFFGTLGGIVGFVLGFIAGRLVLK